MPVSSRVMRLSGASGGAALACLSLSSFCVPCVVLGPAAGQRTARLFVTTGSPLSLYTLFLTCLPSSLLVSSLCWSISWTHHRTDRHRTDRTSKQQPCPLGTRPAPSAHFCFVLISFRFLLSCVFPFPSLSSCFSASFSSFFAGVPVHTVDLFLVAQVIRDCIPQLVSSVRCAY